MDAIEYKRNTITVHPVPYILQKTNLAWIPQKFKLATTKKSSSGHIREVIHSSNISLRMSGSVKNVWAPSWYCSNPSLDGQTNFANDQRVATLTSVQTCNSLDGTGHYCLHAKEIWRGRQSKVIEKKRHEMQQFDEHLTNTFCSTKTTLISRRENKRSVSKPWLVLHSCPITRSHVGYTLNKSS